MEKPKQDWTDDLRGIAWAAYNESRAKVRYYLLYMMKPVGLERIRAYAESFLGHTPDAHKASKLIWEEAHCSKCQNIAVVYNPVRKCSHCSFREATNQIEYSSDTS